MNIGVYEVYRENGICTLREEKTYKTPVERYIVMKSSELYDLCANILKMDKLTRPCYRRSESDKSLDRATGEAPQSELNKLSKPLDRHPKHPL